MRRYLGTRQRQREERGECSERHKIVVVVVFVVGGIRKVCAFEGSQAVPARPYSRGVQVQASIHAFSRHQILTSHKELKISKKQMINI